MPVVGAVVAGEEVVVGAAVEGGDPVVGVGREVVIALYNWVDF